MENLAGDHLLNQVLKVSVLPFIDFLHNVLGELRCKVFETKGLNLPMDPYC